MCRKPPALPRPAKEWLLADGGYGTVKLCQRGALSVAAYEQLWIATFDRTGRIPAVNPVPPQGEQP